MSSESVATVRARLAADQALLTEAEAQLLADQNQLADEQGQLATDQGQLESDQTQLASDQTQLADDAAAASETPAPSKGTDAVNGGPPLPGPLPRPKPAPLDPLLGSTVTYVMADGSERSAKVLAIGDHGHLALNVKVALDPDEPIQTQQIGAVPEGNGEEGTWHLDG